MTKPEATDRNGPSAPGLREPSAAGPATRRKSTRSIEDLPEAFDPTVFALASLGWKAFQDLCGTVLGEVLSQAVSTFRPTKDAGRDFAFEGDWAQAGSEAMTGRFVVQCKFKSRDNFYRSDLTGDLSKVRRLVRSGHCDSYVLMTNAGMTAATATDIADDLAQQGVKHSLLIGGDRLDLYIRETPRLRALVPRLYGLGDLTQILDERRYQQAKALLASMREDIAKFVVTAPYRRAVGVLLSHGFVLLVGAPAAGKSMIASGLSAASIDMWGSRPVKVENAAAFVAAWNPNELHQLFWIDDAFGATQYQRQRADEWNQLMSHLKAAVAQGAKVVMTSRDYIWAEAVADIKLGSFPALEAGQVVVDVHDLELDDKRQILYNHLKYGAQSAEFRAAVKPFLESVANLDEFLPEVARRFGNPQFTRKVLPLAWSVRAFFEKPVEHLEEVVTGLGKDEFAALALLYMAQGSRESPVELSDVETTALARLGSDLAGTLEGLTTLRGSLVTLGPSADRAGGPRWAFKHPTISDAVQRRIAARPELLQIYIIGSPLDSLLSEVTCGDVGLKRALLVPQTYYALVAGRLVDGLRADANRTKIADFIVTRCGAEFLALHGASLGAMEIDPGRPGSVRIATRLRELGLLAEPVRLALLNHFQSMAIGRLDLEVLTDPETRALMNPNELQAFVVRLRDEVVHNLTWYIDSVRDNYDGSEAPDDVVRHLRSSLETLLEVYPDDSEVEECVVAADDNLDRLGSAFEEQWHGDASDDEYDAWRDRDPIDRLADVGIFSDVDE